MTLIHTALFAEAKPIIEHLKLRFIQKKPYRLYQRDNIVLAVTGMGEKTLIIKEILSQYYIKKAINIGIAGCKDKNIPIGALFCTTHNLPHISHSTITTVKKPLNNPHNLKTTLVDMETDYFLEATKDIKEVYVFKVVSDYLDTTIPSKQFVWEIIEKSLKDIEVYFK
ncbi:MAG: nucleoside phosphorylase [Epsilonproteobacteria bacterium]|nr:nucleoside phosphorylase [Campylobacterota bacterium]